MNSWSNQINVINIAVAVIVLYFSVYNVFLYLIQHYIKLITLAIWHMNKPIAMYINDKFIERYAG